MSPNDWSWPTARETRGCGTGSVIAFPNERLAEASLPGYRIPGAMLNTMSPARMGNRALSVRTQLTCPDSNHGDGTEGDSASDDFLKVREVSTAIEN